MPRDPAEVARVWLRRAKGNLARAKQPKPEEGFWEDLCFDAQQAAEKALKAALVFRSVEFPRTHHIAELLVLLREAGQQVPQNLWQADQLSDYAVTTRYPEEDSPVGEDEYRQAVAIAEQAVLWAEQIVGGS